MIGERPAAEQYLFVGLPHTSNWDFVYGWLVVQALQLDVKIFVKDTYFFWPLNHLCRLFGLLPVNRRHSTNFVDAVAEQFKQNKRLGGLIAPEGTRAYKPTLKSGYYYLAKKAGVQIVVAGPNYKNKTFTISASRDPRATFEEDAAQLIEFCKSQVGKHPEYTFH